MTIANYSDLKSNISGWLAKSNLTTQIPTFISLCEAKVNRRIRVMDMSTRATSTTAANGYLGFPDDFGGLRYMKITSSNPEISLEYRTPKQIHDMSFNNEGGIPQVYTVVDSQFLLKPSQDGDTVEIVYYKRVPALSDSNTTNWLLTDHPDIYLYGSLCEAEPYLRNDERLVMWRSLFDQGLEELKDMDGMDRWSGTSLEIRTDTGNPP